MARNGPSFRSGKLPGGRVHGPELAAGDVEPGAVQAEPVTRSSRIETNGKVLRFATEWRMEARSSAV